MDSMTLASTPNWFLNQVMTINHDCSLFAYCVRTDIVIMRNAYAANAFGIDFKTIKTAHKERAAGCVFSPVTDVNKPFYKHLVSYGDDGAIRMWNLTNGQCVMANNAHMKQIDSGHKVVGIDWLKTDPHVIVSVSDNSAVVRWALEANTVKQYSVKGRIFPQCIAASPHNKDIVAIGAKCGHVVIFSMKSDQGTILGRARCFDNDIMALSWCPIASDVIYDKPENEPKYLVAGTKDYGVYVVNTNYTSKAKNDCAKMIANVHLPRTAMSKHNQRFGKNYKKDYGWSVVCWCAPYTIVTTSRFAEVITFQTEPLNTNKDGLQFKFKLVHDKHKSKPILCLACPQTAELNAGIDQVIWTLAVDRHLIRYSLQQCSLTLDLHTCTSYVFGLALSTVPDQSRLAIGVGEGKILIWNMFKRAYLDVTEIWQKIEGKVMSLSFHPAKEGWLGYGTSTGSVGVVDLGSPNKGPFIIYSLEKSKAGASLESEKNAVYRLQWGPFPPAPTSEEPGSKEPFCLYGTSNGEVYVFTPSSKAFKATPPVSLRPQLDKLDTEAGQPPDTRKSDLCWKPDFSALAVANENGSIYILSPQFELMVTLLEHTKLINSLAWHPAYISTCESPYKHWLATGSDKIKVFNIDPENLNVARQPIATLALHSQKITCVAWNPHVNGQLLSTSYDQVAQVWDVPNQTPLVSYHGHTSHVMSGLWSPLDPDLIITGSADGTVQSWRMSKQTTSRPSEKKKSKNSSETAPVATCDVTSEELKSDLKEQFRPKDPNNQYRKQKSVFPITANQLSLGTHLHVLVNRFIKTINPENPATIATKDTVNPENSATIATKDTVNPENSATIATKDTVNPEKSATVANKDTVNPENSATIATKDTVNPENSATIETKDTVKSENPATVATKDTVNYENPATIATNNDTSIEIKEEVLKDASAMETKKREKKQDAETATLSQRGDNETPVTLTNGHLSPDKTVQAENDSKEKHADVTEDEETTEGEEKATPEKDNSDLYLNFFGNREDMSSLVQAELTQHLNNKYITGALGTALWLGDFNVVVRMAMEKEELTDEIVALSQTASLKLWRECCAVYAKQLISHGMILKASNYLLAIHKVEEAVSLLLTNDLYKEALCLAKLRLPETHELTTRAYTAWAEHSTSHGNYGLAAHIYLLLEDGASAMKVLNKASDIRLQYYACMIALNQSNMASTSDTMLSNCFKRSLEKVPLKFAKEMVESHPDHKHFCLWYHGRERSAQMLERPSILSTWAQASDQDEKNIVDKIHADVKDRGLTTKDVDALKELISMCEGMDKAKVLVYISGHLAVSSLLPFPEKLKHILLALKVAYKLQSRVIVFPALLNTALYPRGPLESYALLDKSNTEYSDYVTSMRAFFCDSVVNWLYYCEDKNLTEEKLLSILEHTVENYIADVVSMDTVQYYKAKADLATLETALCQQIVKNNIIKKVDSIENLNMFKPKVNKRASRTPSPEENENDEKETESQNTEHDERKRENRNEDNVKSEEANHGENEVENVKEEAKDVEGENRANKETKEMKQDNETEVKEKEEEKPEIVDEKKIEGNQEAEEANDDQEEKDGENKKRPNDGEEGDSGVVEKKPKLDNEKREKDSDNDLQDFEKATNPNFILPRVSEDEEAEEELTSEEKVQRIKELQETITNFEESRIYSPNPSHLFDLVFKIVNSLNLNDPASHSRIRELVELMKTHSEAFDLV